jgi:hypothetical protein
MNFFLSLFPSLLIKRTQMLTQRRQSMCVSLSVCSQLLAAQLFLLFVCEIIKIPVPFLLTRIFSLFFPLQSDEKAGRQKNAGGRRVVASTPPKIIETPAINEEDDEIDAEVILRPKQLERMKTAGIATTSDEGWSAKPVNKRLQLDAPYFIQRPASENDISTIAASQKQERPTLPSVSSTSDVNFRFSMTPEVPSISFAHLPKNYLETPSIDKFKKQEPTLLEIQTAEIQKTLIDFSMPRYYGKSNLIFDAVGSNTSIASGGSSTSLGHQQQPHHHHQHHKKSGAEKGKRLKQIRAHLPPLMIHKDKEKEK